MTLFAKSAALLILGCTLCVGALPLYAAGSLDASQCRAVLNKYCVTCHNERLRSGNVLLDQIDVQDVTAATETWEKVIRKLRTTSMPPAGAPRPDPATYDSFATYLETAIDRAAPAHPNPGRSASIHRLNRAEYTNAVRDLLALEIKGETLLPSDESTYGFDNMADVLSVSPVLLERYLSAARKVSRMAVGESTVRPYEETYEANKMLQQEERMSDLLPFGSRGGLAVRHHFPQDGEYTLKIKLQRDFRDRIRGLQEAHQLDIRLDGAKVASFMIGGEKKGRSAPIFSSGGVGDPKQEDYEHSADDGLEARFQAKAGAHVIGAAFLRESFEPEGPLQNINSRPESLPRIPLSDLIAYKGGDPGVDIITVGGPFNAQGIGATASRNKIFVCRPATTDAEIPCAERILATLARQAYRRPATREDIQTLMGFYKAASAKSGFEGGIESAMERILMGPEFLFRTERDPANSPPGTSYRLSNLELASRLSFFLWSSIPDNELLDLAAAGKLYDPIVLEQQTRRMLADSRSNALVENFGKEWLHLRNLRSMKPDPDSFPDWDDNLREAFEKEAELFLGSMIREDRGVTDLLSANYTYINDRLARHYGIPGVFGSHFRRITLNDSARGGILGLGSVLAVTSYANRTSPVLRGKWVLENILGSPPPPPPPNVPSLKDRGDNGQVLTVRQRMEQHRANPACAVCHTRMDPLGFALENFDALGRWRTTDVNAPIDPSGVLPDGTKFEGPAGLRKVLLTKQNEFAGTVTEKLLTYAISRGLQYTDQPFVRKIMRESAPNNYRWSSLVLNIVRSEPFQMRRSAGQ